MYGDVDGAIEAAVDLEQAGGERKFTFLTAFNKGD